MANGTIECLILGSKGHKFETQWRHCAVSFVRHFNLFLVLVQPRKTEKHLNMTENLLTGM